MRNYLFVFMLFIVMGYSQPPENFNNQETQFNKIEENIKVISNMIESIIYNKADDPQSRNDLVISVLRKDTLSDEISDMLCKEFLQKYISENDPEVGIKLGIIHKMLNLCFLIKTSVDIANIRLLESELEMLRNYMKLNYKKDPYYRPYKYRKYRSKKSD